MSIVMCFIPVVIKVRNHYNNSYQELTRRFDNKSYNFLTKVTLPPFAMYVNGLKTNNFTWISAMKWIFMLLMAVSTSTPAEIFKCEVDGKVTFSSMPCSDDAEIITVSEQKKMLTDKGGYSLDELAEQCFNVIHERVQFKDPRSAYISKYRLDWASDDSGPRRVLVVSINAREVAGGYVGDEEYKCLLNYDGTRLSNIPFFIDKSK
ncbi:hypothetical protein [Shewanella dokdonensis]|uniref:DUF4124 domain-containing protein n=1 Tax=Shewanella dokdonensis TaxID=712036 RepID=A0ABX8DEG2_9GAMM|nr:hypothetical protein [Shewanella dokdonensis]MCL1072948.1 hypothetical protein [Shewanella dokdonensis]QVK23129.1 hypothetical protein KHX94_18915 [Shewanella dokdonensis]